MNRFWIALFGMLSVFLSTTAAGADTNSMVTDQGRVSISTNVGASKSIVIKHPDGYKIVLPHSFPNYYGVAFSGQVWFQLNESVKATVDATSKPLYPGMSPSKAGAALGSEITRSHTNCKVIAVVPQSLGHTPDVVLEFSNTDGGQDMVGTCVLILGKKHSYKLFMNAPRAQFNDCIKTLMMIGNSMTITG